MTKMSIVTVYNIIYIIQIYYIQRERQIFHAQNVGNTVCASEYRVTNNIIIIECISHVTLSHGNSLKKYLRSQAAIIFHRQ